MSLPKKDIVATALVAVAAVVYVLWQTGAALPGMDGTRGTGLVILGLGFVASATAVVPGFDQLLHGNALYLLGTSLLGSIASVAGILMLAAASGTALTVMFCVMVVLWAVATAHHLVLAEHRARVQSVSTRPRSAGRQLSMR